MAGAEHAAHAMQRLHGRFQVSQPCGSCSGLAVTLFGVCVQGGLSPMHSWPPAHALKGPGRPGLARPPLASSSSLGTAFKGQRQPAQQPPDAAGAPVTAGLSKNVVLRALYKQHFTQTGAGWVPFAAFHFWKG